MNNELRIISYGKRLKSVLPFLTSFFIFCAFFTATFAVDTKTNLGELIPCEGNACGICDIFKLISNVVNFATFKLASPLAGIIIAYGGVTIVISGDNESKRAKGIDAIQSAVWGIIITFGAWVIVNSIIGGLSGNSLSSSWYQFPGCK